mgnify:FL=1
MKKLNKTNLKYIILIFIIFLIYLISILLFNNYQYKKYTLNYNTKINSVLSLLIDKYPSLTKEELINILNNSTDTKENILKQYGLDIEKDSFILNNEKVYLNSIKVTIIITSSLFLIVLFIILVHEYIKLKNINNLTKVLEEINNKNYKIDIGDFREDELSILKSEIYKTTIMLKEQADNSTLDKINLKDSLSNISHQLKTPLTSINIMLDNILDSEEMSEDVRTEFINNIKREISNINFLVAGILKLSRLDANVVNFIVEKVKVKDIINECIKNVSSLCDLKSISIDVTGNEMLKINCDFKWEVEAITNILKNCVEHSNNNSKIDIKYINNKMYTEITIKDYGVGIPEKDVKHIFERFYKGSNSTSDSVGIGLSLSKSIIEQENGTINVNSKLNRGTVFTIRYYNK